VPNLDELLLDIIDISSNMNDEDVRHFIDSEYDKFIKPAPLGKVKGLREHVVTALREKANGMFLWVDLMFSEFKGIKDPKVLRLRLDIMLTGLPTLYKTILTRVEKENGEGKTVAQFKEIFCWVAHFKESLSILDLN